MLPIYLPIAELSIDFFLLIGIGALVGFLSGIFGVGGGFLLTPLLIFLGIPPAVAVASGANQIVGSSVTGALYHWKRGNVDIKMGLIMLGGGLAGSSFGVVVFGWLQQIGQLDLIVRLIYVLFLGGIGALMFWESMRALRKTKLAASGAEAAAGHARGKLHRHNWLHKLPFKTRFRRSNLYISAILPVGLGALIGILTAIMGVGGGFLLIPAMVYVLGMPTLMVIGTSLFQIIFVTANATFWQAYLNQSVDIFLTVLLLVGGVIGAQLGGKYASFLRGEQLRSLLALIVLLVAGVLAATLIWPPSDLYVIEEISPLMDMGQ